MKTYILTVKIKVDSEDIRKARRWAKRRGFKYAYKGDDCLGSMVFDYLTDGVM